MPETLIVGAGWAGLAAGATLARFGLKVKIYESAKTAGGRARSIKSHALVLDNGQHIMLGAYHHTLELLRLFQVPEQQVLSRQNLDFLFRHPQQGVFQLRLPSYLPSPLHLLAGLLAAKGFKLKEKFLAVRMAAALQAIAYQLPQDRPLKELLQQYRQTPKLVKVLWEPLCLAALNTPIATASAQIFLNVLKETFDAPRAASDILLFKTDLSSAFVTPAKHYIRTHKGQVLCQHKVEKLIIQNNRITGILCNGQVIHCNQLILATPFRITRKLLQPYPQLQTLCKHLEAMYTAPIYTAYFRYPPHTRLPEKISGMLGSHGQWIFDRRLCQQPGILALVISSQGAHETYSQNILLAILQQELINIFPHLPVPLEHFIIREKHATFYCSYGIQTLRPNQLTPVQGLYLCGDYTQTPYPATLESAVFSGVLAANKVLQARGSQQQDIQ